MGAIGAPAAPRVGRGGQKGFQPVHLRLQIRATAGMAADVEFLPQGSHQTGSGEAGKGQRSDSRIGGANRSSHGRLSLCIRHMNIWQCRRQSRAGRSQEEFVFGRQGYHGEGIS
jgi:hypothetical protein